MGPLRGQTPQNKTCKARLETWTGAPAWGGHAAGVLNDTDTPAPPRQSLLVPVLGGDHEWLAFKNVTTCSKAQHLHVSERLAVGAAGFF